VAHNIIQAVRVSNYFTQLLFDFYTAIITGVHYTHLKIHVHLTKYCRGCS